MHTQGMRRIRLRYAPNRRAASHVLLIPSDKCENIVVQDVLCTAPAQCISRTTQADLVQQNPVDFLSFSFDFHGFSLKMFIVFSLTFHWFSKMFVELSMSFHRIFADFHDIFRILKSLVTVRRLSIPAAIGRCRLGAG